MDVSYRMAVGAILIASLGVPSAPPATAATTATTATAATIKTAANLRAAPNTVSTIRAELPAGTAVDVVCWTRGEPTYGTDVHGSMWLFVTRGGWVHSFLVTPIDVDPCGSGGGVFYDNCDEAPGPIHATEPGYGPHLDRDRDGIGCERSN